MKQNKFMSSTKKINPFMIWALKIWSTIVAIVFLAITHFKILGMENRPEFPIVTTILFIVGLVYIWGTFHIMRVQTKLGNRGTAYFLSNGYSVPPFFAMLGAFMRMPPWQVYLLLALSFILLAISFFQVAAMLKEEPIIRAREAEASRVSVSGEE